MEWVNVKDALPIDGQRVLIIEDSQHTISRYIGGRFVAFSEYDEEDYHPEDVEWWTPLTYPC